MKRCGTKSRWETRLLNHPSARAFWGAFGGLANFRDASASHLTQLGLKKTKKLIFLFLVGFQVPLRQIRQWRVVYCKFIFIWVIFVCLAILITIDLIVSDSNIISTSPGYGQYVHPFAQHYQRQGNHGRVFAWWVLELVVCVLRLLLLRILNLNLNFSGQRRRSLGKSI